MQRGEYNSVTEIPVLVPCQPGQAEGRATWGQGVGGLQPVRVLSPKDLDPKTWRNLGAKEREQLLASIALRQALEANDRLAIEKACQRVEGSSDPLIQAIVQAASRRFPSYPRNELSCATSEGVSKAQLKLWWTGKRFLPALFCPDMMTALYVRALIGIIGGKALLVCPHCGKPFVQVRSDQDYCSVRCREAHRVARWRAAKKRRAGKKSRKASRRLKSKRRKER